MNILTFDIEDWFHILHEYPDDILKKWQNYEVRIHAGMDKIFDVLLTNNIKATFFVVGYIAKRHPEIVKKIHEHGFEVAAHSYMHKVVYSQSRKEFKKDLSLCINTLEDITGVKVNSFRAPGFSIKTENVWIFDILNQLGITKDASIFPAIREDGGFINFKESGPAIIDYEGSTIKEFPMSTHKFLGKRFTTTGGGYFRFFPYRLIRFFIERSNYTMTYFHPRDFDDGQPILEGLSFKRRFKSYYNISSAYIKLKQLIYEFDFIDMKQADEMIDWQNVPRLKINRDGECFKL